VLASDSPSPAAALGATLPRGCRPIVRVAAASTGATTSSRSSHT